MGKSLFNGVWQIHGLVLMLLRDYQMEDVD